MRWIDLYEMYSALTYMMWDLDQPTDYYVNLTEIMGKTRYYHQKCKHNSTVAQVYNWNTGKPYPDSRIVHCPNCGDFIGNKEVKI